MTTNTVKVPSL